MNWFFAEPNVGRSVAMKGSRESAFEAFWNIDVCHLDGKCRSLSLIDDDGAPLAFASDSAQRLRDAASFARSRVQAPRRGQRASQDTICSKQLPGL
jgi:hypothetical protein